MRQLALPWLLLALPLAGLLGVSGCSDDTYIATNEPEDGGVGASAGSNTGGAGWADAAQGGAGQGGTAGYAGAAAAAGTPGSGGSSGVCTPGEKQDTGSCEKCGTKRQTCDSSGQWGAEVCEGQGTCEPGQEDVAACPDSCESKACESNCTWSACKLKTGAACKHEGGTNFQCCGTDMWQFCSTTCNWHPCAPCGSSSGCQSSC